MIKVRKTSMVRADIREVENKKDESTIYLYGDIGGWFGIDHLEWVKDFNSISAKTIHLRIDSDGGDIFAARAMKTAIMQHDAKVIAHIDGIAASAASFMSMGADEIEIVDGGFLMIHNALSLIDILGFFNAHDLDELISDLTKERNLHNKINESIANDYVNKSGNSLDAILQWMNDETWFTAKEALDNKLVDRIYDGEPTKGNYDLSVFNNVPEELKLRNQAKQKMKKDLNERDLEKNLRDAGYSRNQAKDIVAKVFQDVRDAQTEPVDQNVRDAQDDDADHLRDADPANVEGKDGGVKKDNHKVLKVLSKAKFLAI